MPPKKESVPCDNESIKIVTSPKVVRGKDGRFSTPEKHRNKHVTIETTNTLVQPILVVKTNNAVINNALNAFLIGIKKGYAVSKLFFQKIGGGFFTSLFISLWCLVIWISGWVLYSLGLSQKGFEFWEKKPFWLRCIHGVFSCGATVYLLSFIAPYLPLVKRTYAAVVKFATTNHVKELFNPNNKAYLSVIVRFIWKGIVFVGDSIIYILLRLLYHIVLFKVTVDTPYMDEHAINKTSPVNATNSTNGNGTRFGEPFFVPLNATYFDEVYEKIKEALKPKN